MSPGKSRRPARSGDRVEFFGDVFRNARERRGIELSEIIRTTKITKAALEALERDDIDCLPGGIFTRSFVRAYAGAVGLDPEATLQAFLDRFPVRTEGETALAGDSRRHDALWSQQRGSRIALPLVVLSVVLVTVLVTVSWRETPAEPQASPAPVVEPAAATRATAPPPADSPATTALTPRPADVAPAPPVVNAAALGPLTIDIHPTAECWVSATVDGEVRIWRIMQAGEREVLEAEREVVVNVGNAGAFVFAINERPGRSLGSSGEVVTARINRDNYRSYVLE